MYQPVTCDTCLGDHERNHMAYEVVIEAQRLPPDLRRRLCPRCARAGFRRRRFGLSDEWAADGATRLLERSFGEDLRIRSGCGRGTAAGPPSAAGDGHPGHRHDPHDRHSRIGRAAKTCHEAP
jgi:hypothetical protein